MTHKKILISKLTELIVDEGESSSDSEDIIPLLKKRTLESEMPRLLGYAEKIVPLQSEVEFKSHFRLSPETVLAVEEMISQDPDFKGKSLIVDIHKQMLMTLWVLATPDSFRSVAELFGVSKSTVWFCFKKIISAVARLSTKVIKWPTIAEMQISASNFEDRTGFPGVIGCIDGSHVPILAPRIHPEVYVNRKSFHSIILQGTVNSNLEYINCYVGEVGSVHDAMVFQKSHVGRNLIYQIPDNFHLLGDNAYPLSVHLMKPFKDNGHLTRQQVTFNRKLSSTRSDVERSFGLLKGRFRRLKNLDCQKVEFCPTIIMAACVLHNITRTRGDVIDIVVEDDEENDDGNEEEDDTTTPSYAAAVQKRNRLMQLMCS